MNIELLIILYILSILFIFGIKKYKNYVLEKNKKKLKIFDENKNFEYSEFFNIYNNDDNHNLILESILKKKILNE